MQTDKRIITSNAMSEKRWLPTKIKDFFAKFLKPSSKEEQKNLSKEELRKEVEETYDPEFVAKMDKIYSHLPSKEEVIRMLKNGV